jgi:hypothetical protein
MNSSRENIKGSTEKKNLSSSSSKKGGEMNMVRKKPSVTGSKTARQDHSNNSKTSNGSTVKKMTTNSSNKALTSSIQPAEKKQKEAGFKNIKKKVIGTQVNSNNKENGKLNNETKKTSEVTSTLKPKALNTSTPRTNNSSVFSGKSIQKT